ncbi:MAG: hypothetical protein KDC84_07265 [Crocinitomicaceae bacterium]|nr:hypothetical protein [Crocinitomicaceae bacterium]
MRTILTISVIYFSVFALGQGNEGNSNNSNNSNGVNSNILNYKVEEKLKKVEKEEAPAPEVNTGVFDSQLQSGRYNYEFTRKKFIRQNLGKGFTSEQQKTLDQQLENLKESAENSFEFNYLTYVNGNHDVSLFPFLEKAYKLKPYDASLFDDFIAYYEITDNATKKAEFTKKLMASNAIESGVYRYNENVLRSIDKNGILITNGYDDTYPLWVLQNEKAMRKDVKVLSLDILQNKEYRKRILKQYGLKDPGVGPENQDFIMKLLQVNPDKNIFLGYTVPKYVLKGLSINLKNTGLALKYAPKRLNEDKLKINFENELQLDYLLQNQSSSKVKQMNANYLVMLSQLYKKYKQDPKKQEYIKSIALKIGRDINKEKTVKASLGI